MGGELESIGIAEARSALAWWLEAGVDVAVQEEPRDWLKPRLLPEAPVPTATRSQSSSEPEPRNARGAPGLAGEQRTACRWLGPAARRMLPHGPENAADHAA